jgi:DNA-binding transcriptional LysR family regulator
LPCCPSPGGRSLFTDPYVVIAAAGSAMADESGPVSTGMLAELSLVTAQRCRDSKQLEDRLRERGAQPNVVHRSDDNATVEGLVAAGVCVAVVPRLAAVAAGSGIIVRELEEPLPPRRGGLAWRGDRRMPRSRGDFIAAVRTTCSELSLAHS